jgi:hypothetical protein
VFETLAPARCRYFKGLLNSSCLSVPGYIPQEKKMLPALVSVEANICLIGIICSNIIYLF